MTTIKQFVNYSYKLINPSSPNQPLQGDDELTAIFLLNQLMTSYADDGLMLTIAKTVTVPINAPLQSVIIGPATVLPPPTIVDGRPAAWNNAWLQLQGVTYPLIFKSREEFEDSFKYEPLQGLPRLIIPYPQVDFVEFRIFPAPSQFFDFYLRGKFQLPAYVSTDTIDNLPGYYQRYLMFALAKDIALFKGRVNAWTPLLEQELVKATNNMQATSEVNLAILGEEESLLNGAWRVRAGV